MDLFSIAYPAFIEGWQLIIQPLVLGYLILGVMLGLAIGIFPGLGGIAGLSLVLPFMFGLDPVLGLALMVGLVAVVPTSDTFASVLMGIPGSSASQLTTLAPQHHPRAQRRDREPCLFGLPAACPPSKFRYPADSG